MAICGNSGELGEGVVVSVKPSVARVMADYDSLPPAVRQAVAAARLDWDTPAIRRELEAGRIDAPGVVRLIEDFEADLARKRRG